MRRLVLVFLTASWSGMADGAGQKAHVGDWAEWVNQYRAQHGCTGQVTTKDLLSHYLYSLARSAKGVLEIGTWRGCGSTLVIAKGLIDGGNGANLTTFEVNAQRAQEAKSMTSPLPVTVVHAPTAPADDILPQHAVMSGALPPAMKESERGQYLGWWKGEHAEALKLQQAGIRPAIKPLCASREIDVAFLDGGEFYGRADLQAVLRHCPTLRYIALDDTMTFKNDRAVKQLISAESGWMLCQEDRTDRHGWAIFARKDASGLETTPCVVVSKARTHRLGANRG